MLVEANDTVIMQEGEDLASGVIGGLWDEFKVNIPEPQAKVLVEAFNLILLTDPDQLNEDTGEIDEDTLMGRPQSLLPGIVQDILLDPNLDLPNKKLAVYEQLINNTINLLKKIGFTLDEDYVTAEYLPELCKIGQFFFEMDGYEDLIGLRDDLEAVDIPTVDRFLLVFGKYVGEEVPLDTYELLIQDVSEVVLTTIRNNLAGEDLSVGVPDNIVKRVKGNLVAIQDTLAYQHIKNNGQLGGSVESFINFFQSELVGLLEDPEEPMPLQYIRELIGIYLISDLNNNQVRDQLLGRVHEVYTSHLALIKAEELVNHLVLDNE